MAAGTKRKHAIASTADQTASAGPSRLSKRPARPVAADLMDGSDDDDGDDDFDDGEDLLAAAQAGTAVSEGEEEGSDDDEDENDEDMSEGGAGASAYESEGDEDDFELLDGEDDAEQDDEESAVAGGSKSLNGKKKSKVDLYALPTNEELQALTEVGEQFKSGLVKMKIEEMVSSVTPKHSKAKPLEAILHRLRSLVESIEPIPATSVKEAAKAIKKRFPASNVTIPYGSVAPPKKDAQYSLAFEPPAALQLVGSWPLKVAAKRPSGLDVDVALVMPSSLFQEKDHMNYRYFHKRAFYLAVVAAAISTSEELRGVQVTFGGDERRPTLVLSPPKDKSGLDFSKLKAEVRIHLAHQPDLFPPARLAPGRNNVRSASADDEASGSALAAPTPRYNASILLDSLRAPHLVYLHATAKACPAFTDAALLLRVWAFQRGFGSGHTTDGSVRRLVAGTEGARFVLTMVLAHLLHGEELSDRKAGPLGVAARAKLFNTFSSYQLFRGCIDWLATHDFASHPVFMKSAPEHGLVSRSDRIPREDFTAQYERVLVDPTGSVNLLDEWTPGAVDLLQHEARLTFAMLDDEGPTDHFSDIFLRAKSCPSFTFDELASVRLESSHSEDAAAFDHASAAAATLAAVQTTLRRALATRCHFTTVLQSAEESGKLRTLNSKSFSAPSQIELGFLYRGTQAQRIVEHGPLQEDVAASEEFRQFWGEEVAELRRFKDGRISYSVVWEVGPRQAERAGIPRRIVRHVMQRHHGDVLAGDAIRFEGGGFTGLVEAPESVTKAAYLASPEERGGFQLVQSAFDTLVKQLRSLPSDEVPLSLITATPCSPGLRGTSTFIPAPLDVAALGTPRTPDCASWLPVHDVILSFEASGKWPDDLEAIQGMKMALLERVAAALQTVIGEGMHARIAFDADAVGAGSIQDEVSLELTLPSGFAFRLRIQHDRERVLLERIVADRFATPAQRSDATRALTRHRQRFTHAPKHHARVAALVHRFPALGETTRLLKRWVRAHQLDEEGHVPNEALELLAASVFVNDTPLGLAPSTGQAGFTAALRRLAGWDWKAEPLLVAVQAAILASDQQAGKAENATQSQHQPFKEARTSDPSLSRRAWFIVTDDEEEEAEASDEGSDAFSLATMRGPAAASAHALQTLARGACGLIAARDGQEEGDTMALVKALFKPSLGHFDFLLYLNPAVLSRYAPQNISADASIWSSSSSGSFKNKPSKKAGPVTQLGRTPRPGFDAAASFVQLLRGLYSDSLRLYYDVNGGDVVGGLWNPALSQREGKRFKPRIGFNAMPVDGKEGGENVKLNKEAVLAELERLGEGLVVRVESKEK
ncbi:Nrap protein [Jaminaea rosea]|uniref:Nrap protein n=1 Tax=Jaminaea rosea TaxID=1569628 RepID=A0A316UXC0_9BASI|nr:Nrap protein [Jaminaea rosea]PWN29957.1 Nrap protein [Jaminaea rosea]